MDAEHNGTHARTGAPDYSPPRFKQYPDGYLAPVSPGVTTNQRVAWNSSTWPERSVFDLIVVGGGLSGVAASVAAARRGLDVVLLEPTHMVGGQATAAGVSAFDITFAYDRALNDHGLWGEVVARIIDVYDNELRRPPNVGHYRNASLTPNVGVVERVLSELLAESGVTVVRNTTVVSAMRSDDRVIGVECREGLIYAPVTVDATEDGSLLALSGVAHRIANVTAVDVGRDDVADLERRSIQDITWTATIREYPDGVPSALRLTAAPPGYAEMLPRLRRYYPGAGVPESGAGHRVGPLAFAGYRAAPDLARPEIHRATEWERVTRTNLNHGNDTAVKADYLVSKGARMLYEVRAMHRTLSVLYYLQNELCLPWSVVTDEGFAEGPDRKPNPLLSDRFQEIAQHMPLIPYIRESRRIIGVSTLTGKSIARPGPFTEAEWRPDCVAVGTYHPDLHGGRLPTDFEGGLGESIDDKPGRLTFGPFPIPLGSLVPASTDGLLAAEKNISASRLASSAARVHPTVMAIGEAVGVLAALSVRRGVRPREVPAAAVQYELAHGGALVAPLRVAGISDSAYEFEHVMLGLARQRVPYEISRPAGAEAHVSVDLSVAERAGRTSARYLRRQGWAL